MLNRDSVRNQWRHKSHQPIRERSILQKTAQHQTPHCQCVRPRATRRHANSRDHPSRREPSAVRSAEEWICYSKKKPFSRNQIMDTHQRASTLRDPYPVTSRTRSASTSQRTLSPTIAVISFPDPFSQATHLITQRSNHCGHHTATTIHLHHYRCTEIQAAAERQSCSKVEIRSLREQTRISPSPVALEDRGHQ